MKEPLSMPPCAGNRCAAIQMSGLKLHLIEIGIIEVSVQFECACSEVHAICDHWGTDRLSLYIYPNINETGLAQ